MGISGIADREKGGGGEGGAGLIGNNLIRERIN